EVRSGLASLEAAPLQFAFAHEAPRHSITDLPPAYRLQNPDLMTAQKLLGALHADLADKSSPEDLTPRGRWDVRTKTLLVEQALHHMEPRLMAVLAEDKARILGESRATLR